MNIKSKAFLYTLDSLAWEYIEECLKATREVLSNKGTKENVKERHIPTIDYFLRIWIPRNYSKKDTIKRSTYYRWLKWDNTEKQRVVKNIDENFRAVAGDIVANEGKGIFFAKNKLGWTDKLQTDNTNTNIQILNIDPLDDSNDNITK
jgi:uncharacterized protein YaaR (DUF327 family)